MNNFLILNINPCDNIICNSIKELHINDNISIVNIYWDTHNDYFNQYNIILYHIDEEDNIIDLIFDKSIKNKNYILLKSFLKKGKYKFLIRTICNNTFSNFNEISFFIDKISLEQNLIG